MRYVINRARKLRPHSPLGTALYYAEGFIAASTWLEKLLGTVRVRDLDVVVEQGTIIGGSRVVAYPNGEEVVDAEKQAVCDAMNQWEQGIRAKRMLDDARDLLNPPENPCVRIASETLNQRAGEVLAKQAKLAAKRRKGK